MKAELCRFCLKSGILCPKCREKVRKGEVTRTDLEVARLLVSLEEKYPPLQDVYFHKSVEAGGVLAIVVGKGDIARMLSYGGKIIKDLEREVNKKIRVLEYNSDERKFLEDLFAPMSILTINKIWLPDGTTETRVVLKRGRRMKPQVKMKSLKKIAKKLYDMSLRIEFAS